MLFILISLISAALGDISLPEYISMDAGNLTSGISIGIFVSSMLTKAESKPEIFN